MKRVRMTDDGRAADALDTLVGAWLVRSVRCAGISRARRFVKSLEPTGRAGYEGRLDQSSHAVSWSDS